MSKVKVTIKIGDKKEYNFYVDDENITLNKIKKAIEEKLKKHFNMIYVERNNE